MTEQLKHYLLLLGTLPLLISVGLGCKTQQKSVETKVITISSDSYNHLFWEINRNDLNHPSYLYGTIHIIPNDSFFLPPVVIEQLDKSEHLVTEIVLDAQSMMATAMQMILTPPNSLKSLLSEDDYQYLQQFMQDSMPVSIPMYQMIKPIFLAQQISTMYCLREQPNSYELYFTNLFKKAEKPISGLETVEEQVAFFNEIPLEEQVHELMETVRSPQTYCSQFQDMFRLYRQQRLDQLMQMVDDDPTLKDRTGNLLYKRNKNWVKPLMEQMKEGKVFIAVGAAHLPGDQGLIELLKAEGYTVTAVY